MAKSLDLTYAYVDLGALGSRLAHDEGEDASTPDAETCCRGKTLLLVTTRGVEIACVPTIIH